MIQPILFAFFAGLGDVAGGLLVILSPRQDRRLLAVLVGFGAGFMLAVALIGMLPVAVVADGGLLAVLIGYLVVHLTQHSLTPHFHFGEETHQDEMVSRGVGVWALIGLVPHSFFDGVAIMSASLESAGLGTLVFVAILLHKMPTGVSLASIMVASGNTRRQAIAAVLAIGLATIVGAVATPAVTLLARWGLALAAGVTIYVAASNLIPESQRERSWLVQGGIFGGVIAYFLIRAMLPGM